MSFLLALVIGLFSLRVRAIFFAMITLALWLRYNGPDTSLAFEIMMDVLLIVVSGGMGTMYGAVVGAPFGVVDLSPGATQVKRMGRTPPQDRHRPAWPGAHRPRHGRAGRLPERTG